MTAKSAIGLKGLTFIIVNVVIIIMNAVYYVFSPRKNIIVT